MGTMDRKGRIEEAVHHLSLVAYLTLVRESRLYLANVEGARKPLKPLPYNREVDKFISDHGCLCGDCVQQGVNAIRRRAAKSMAQVTCQYRLDYLVSVRRILMSCYKRGFGGCSTCANVKAGYRRGLVTLR